MEEYFGSGPISHKDDIVELRQLLETLQSRDRHRCEKLAGR